MSTAAPTIVRAPAPERPTSLALTTRSSTIPKLPGLDGLRGVAVMAVLVFHAGFSWAKGGFLGVSTFFTLSGFLITMLLMWEFSGEGRIDLRRFWSRRYRRLMPAALLCLAGVVAFGYFVATPSQLAHLRGDILASLFYVANWRFILTGQSYASLFAAPSPVLHFWSLAIEEQFYLVFPLVVAGALAVGRGSRRVLGGVLGVAALVSLSLMWVLYTPGQDPSRVYYGTGTRAFELLLGALLALVLSHPAGFVLRIPRWAWSIAGAIGAIVTVALWTCARQSSPWLYRGGLAGYAVMSCLLIVATIRTGWIRSALSFRALRWLGAISYGVYLFHWPIYLWLTPARTHLSIWPLFGLRLAVTLALAVASAKLLEMPVRDRRRPVRVNPILLSGVAISLVVIGSVAVTRTDAGDQISFTALTDAGDNFSVPPVPTTVPSAVTAPVLPPATRLAPGETPRILVLGDSEALTLANGLERWATETGGATVSNAGKLGCSVARGGSFRYLGQAATMPDYCDWTNDFAPRAAAMQPNVVMALFGTFDIVDRLLPGDDTWRGIGDPVFDDRLRGELSAVMDAMQSSGATVLWLTTPYIQAGIDKGLTGPFPENDHERTDRYNTMVREVAATKPRVKILDLQNHLEQLPEGELDVGDRPDGVHWTRNSAYALEPWLAQELLAVVPTTTAPARSGG